MTSTISGRTVDDKGRDLVDQMSDSEILKEILVNQRKATDLIEEFVEAASRHPMLKMMIGKIGM